MPEDRTEWDRLLAAAERAIKLEGQIEKMQAMEEQIEKMQAVVDRQGSVIYAARDVVDALNILHCELDALDALEAEK